MVRTPRTPPGSPVVGDVLRFAREFDVAVHEEELDLDVGITMRPEGPIEGRVRPRSR